MKIRKAKISDLDNIMLMYTSCVKGMIANDIDQWDETYPNKEVITKDITRIEFFQLHSVLSSNFFSFTKSTKNME